MIYGHYKKVKHCRVKWLVPLYFSFPIMPTIDQIPGVFSLDLSLMCMYIPLPKRVTFFKLTKATSFHIENQQHFSVKRTVGLELRTYI